MPRMRYLVTSFAWLALCGGLARAVEPNPIAIAAAE